MSGIGCLNVLGYIGSALAVDNVVEPQGNLGSIYRSQTPYYGSAHTYSSLGYIDEYDAESREYLVSLGQWAFIQLVTAVCPPLGAGLDRAWDAANKLKDLYTALQNSVNGQTVKAIYVRVKYYEPPTQPNPKEVVYSKCVIEYYNYIDSQYTQLWTTDYYYQKLVYNLYA